MIPIKKLYELQELDLQTSADETSLAEVRARLADDSALVSARKQIDSLDSQLSERTPLRTTVEQTVQQLDDKIKAAEKRLYGGDVTNPRGVLASEEERSYLQSQRSDEEDKLLDLMVEIEDLRSAHNEAGERLVRLEAERVVEQTDLQKEEQRLLGELDGLRQARPEMTPHIPSSALSVYESLRKSKNGHAVAKVSRGLCQGCRIALPSMELQRARSSQQMVQCNSCHRILYVV